MDIAAILLLIQKGVTIAEALIAAGESAAPAFTALKNLITGAQKGSVSDADLDATEAQLDKLIEDFNLDIDNPHLEA